MKMIKMELNIIRFIKTTPNWRDVIAEKPYYITIHTNAKYPYLFLLKYNQIRSNFYDPVVKECRGIIVHVEKDVVRAVCVPFFKFGNYGEGYADKIDWTTARIQEKVDGSIMKLWYYFDIKRWMLSTNGTIDAFKCDLPFPTQTIRTFGDAFNAATALGATPEVPCATCEVPCATCEVPCATCEVPCATCEVPSTTPEVPAITLQAFADKCNLDPMKTYMFELTGPYNKVVIQYPLDIYHIGTRHNITMVEERGTIAIKRPKTYNFTSLDETVAFSKTLSINEEGFVVVDDAWNRVKVKGTTYLALHRMKGGGVDPKGMLLLIIAGETDEYLSYFPEHAGLYKDIKDKLDRYIATVYQQATAINHIKDKKDYARAALKTINQTVMFDISCGKLTLKDFDQQFVKTYTVEKILFWLGGQPPIPPLGV
jgi:hypothetical protein